MSKLPVWKLIDECIRRDVPVMLLYVLESVGSSPGRQGFCMAVSKDGAMAGSIGGGIMEHKFVEVARDKLKQAQSLKPGIIRKQVHSKDQTKNQSGMICSGEQTVWIYQLTEKDKDIVQQMVRVLEGNEPATVRFSPEGISVLENITKDQYYYRFQSDEDWIYVENIVQKENLYIIGGGHCGLALSRVMSMLDFSVHIFDERAGLKTMVENTFAAENRTIDSYNNLKELIPEGFHSWVVIMTFGYRTDDIVVRTLWGRKFRYIGLLGSKSKIEKMFADYRGAGMDEQWLQALHAPVGLPIKSETPEEIAISIAAEIISIRNRQ